MKQLCPKCKSSNITMHEDEGISFITCKTCGYDEMEELYPSGDPGERTSQKEKARHSPYKTGGKGRSRHKH